MKGNTGEFIVGDGAGVWKTRTVRRKIESERWNKDTIKLVRGVPWKVNPQDPNVVGEEMKVDVTVMGQHYRDQLRGQREELEKVPRNFYLKERDFESHGYTEGCPLKRGTRLAHSKGCRVRVEEAMRGDERLERAKKRTNAHLAKLVKANVEKAEAEKKLKLDKDMEVDTGVSEAHGAIVFDGDVDRFRYKAGHRHGSWGRHD